MLENFYSYEFHEDLVVSLTFYKGFPIGFLAAILMVALPQIYKNTFTRLLDVYFPEEEYVIFYGGYLTLIGAKAYRTTVYMWTLFYGFVGNRILRLKDAKGFIKEKLPLKLIIVSYIKNISELYFFFILTYILIVMACE